MSSKLKINNFGKYIYVPRTDDVLASLTERERLLTQAYEYILSDQWGKGRPDPLNAELQKTKSSKKPSK